MKALVKFKIVFVGDQSVGKTCIINRFVNEEFTGQDKVFYQAFIWYLKPTVGIDFVSGTLHL